jgi:hypothetical protein
LRRKTNSSKVERKWGWSRKQEINGTETNNFSEKFLPAVATGSFGCNFGLVLGIVGCQSS